jgi:hypothetical protein
VHVLYCCFADPTKTTDARGTKDSFRRKHVCFSGGRVEGGGLWFRWDGGGVGVGWKWIG